MAPPPGARRRRGSRKGKPKRARSVNLDRYRSVVDDWAAFQAAAARPEPTVFRVRSGRYDEATVLARLTEKGFPSRPLEGLPGFHQVVEGAGSLALTLEHWLGMFYIQQASTGVAAPALGPLPGERILDLCAAPGGKTTHIAELMGDTGSLVASEISESRIRGLLGNVYRLGHPGIFVVASDGRDFPEEARFDRVLLDAPCSGEGTLRRRGGQAPNQSRSFLGYVTRVQADLVAKAVRVTRPGGTILYVTCTFAPEENEAVVSEALRTLPVELEPLDLPVPHAPGLTHFDGTTFDPRVEGAARIYPHHLDSGGLFLARLRRLDDGDEGREGAWTPLPAAFPADEEEGAAEKSTVEAQDAADREDEAQAQLRRGVEEVRDRFGLGSALDRSGWILRGGRAWMHTLDAWPLPAWSPGAWRAISAGFRAIDFDSRDRPRPTNDFLRWLDRDVESRVLDVDTEELQALTRREVVSTEEDDRGPVALRFEGSVVGRGAVTGEGLKSEIPKARAADLRRIFQAREERADDAEQEGLEGA